MNFGQAIAQLKLGNKVRRKHWLGYWQISDMVYMEDKSDWLGTVIVAFRIGGDIDVNAPAQPYQADILAEDWELVV